MEVMYPRCAGLDVHRDEIVACCRLVVNGNATHEVRKFGTMTGELLALSEWLSEHEVTHVVMEATGVYWVPAWRVLEGNFELVLANAAHVKNVPGRKTDVNDATWLSELLAHGLVRSSFVPPTDIQDLRALTRTRKQLVRERVSHVQRIDKVLQQANIKLGSVLTNIMGKSGRAILNAIVDGETDPAKLVEHVEPSVKAPRQQIIEALRGNISSHHRFLLKLHLKHVDALQSTMDEIDQEVGERLEPFRNAAERLTRIPGVGEIVAAAIVSEIGSDMSRFKTAAHLISWAGLCPRCDESAGKRRSRRLRKGAPWLKTLLVQAAWAAIKKKSSYLRAQYFRLQARRGPKKAIMAVAASILTAVYWMLKDGTEYEDLGSDYFQKQDRVKSANRLLRRLSDLGFEVAEIRDRRAVA